MKTITPLLVLEGEPRLRTRRGERHLEGGTAAPLLAAYALLSVLLVGALAFGGAAAARLVCAEGDPSSPALWAYRPPPPGDAPQHAPILPLATVPAAASAPVAGAPAENGSADEELPAQSFDFDAPFVGG